MFFLLFDCYIYRKNVTCLKRFTRYGHYTVEVEGRVTAIRRATVSQIDRDDKNVSLASGTIFLQQSNSGLYRFVSVTCHFYIIHCVD